MPRVVLSIAETAKFCRMSNKTIRTICEKGVIGCRHRGTWRIDQEEADGLKLAAKCPLQSGLDPDRIAYFKEMKRLGKSINQMEEHSGYTRNTINRYMNHLAVLELVGDMSQEERITKLVARKIARQLDKLRLKGKREQRREKHDEALRVGFIPRLRDLRRQEEIERLKAEAVAKIEAEAAKSRRSKKPEEDRRDDGDDEYEEGVYEDDEREDDECEDDECEDDGCESESEENES